MSNPISGVGDSFEFASVASPTVYTTLNGVTSFAFSGQKLNTEKSTTMSGNGVETYQSMLYEPGSLDVKGFWLPGETSQTALLALCVPAGPTVAMKCLYGTSNTASFSGIVESVTPGFPLDKLATVDIKIKVTGTITYA